MLIIGSKGHAKEIIDILQDQNTLEELTFFDDVSEDLSNSLFGIFRIIKTESEAKDYLRKNQSFILGLGGSQKRLKLCSKFESWGGKAVSVIASSSKISKHDVVLNNGINIMHNVVISSGVSVGKGSLINAGCLIHHDVSIGEFCEISPGTILTGKVRIGNYSTIGSGTIIIPNTQIGSNVIVGAGTVIISDVKDNEIVAGVPSKIIGINS